MRHLITAGIAAAALTAGVTAPGADTVTYFGKLGDLYLYQASQDDGAWNVGDVVSLTGMDKLTSTLSPPGFGVAFNPYQAIWTCNQATNGDITFGVLSIEAAGSISWSIAANGGSSGSVTGPEYVPEPVTAILFSVGLLTLGLSARRRRAAGQSRIRGRV